MKNALVILILFSISFFGFSQNSRYEYRGRSTPSIKKDKLSEANLTGDIMPEFCRYFQLPYKERALFDQRLRNLDYPYQYFVYPQENYNRIIDFVSIEITATCHGKEMKSQSTSARLTVEQRNILKTADLCSDLHIKIKFKYKNPENDKLGNGIRIREGEYVVTVVPEIEAEFPGGFEQLSLYLRENFVNKITKKGAYENIHPTLVRFSVNEKGQIVGAKISSTSGDPEIDNLLLDATNKMPVWKPAENPNGIKVKQEFSIPFGGGC